jgi:hypothetical protein
VSARGEQASIERAAVGSHTYPPWRRIVPVNDDVADLGVVYAPSGVLVLAMAGFLDYWNEEGRRLSERALAAAAGGGGHVHEWLAEMVAVPVSADRALAVRASTSPSADGDVPTIAILEVGLGLPASSFGPVGGARILGDLPVDRTGMLLGDAIALDSWVGFLTGTSTDGLADVRYWGRNDHLVQAEFGGEPVGRFGSYGWLDLPVAHARSRVASINAWAANQPECAARASLEEHTHYHLADRAGWGHPLHVGTVEVAGCAVNRIGWDQGDHSARHRGERKYGQVYPVSVAADANGEAVLRWTIRPTN